MSTIGPGKVITTILDNNGQFEDDPPVVRAYRYLHLKRCETMYWITYFDRQLRESEFVGDPVLLFDINSGLTEEGKMELEKLKSIHKGT